MELLIVSSSDRYFLAFSIILLPAESPLKKETVWSYVDILGGTKAYFCSFCLSPDSTNGEIYTADDPPLLT